MDLVPTLRTRRRDYARISEADRADHDSSPEDAGMGQARAGAKRRSVLLVRFTRPVHCLQWGSVSGGPAKPRRINHPPLLLQTSTQALTRTCPWWKSA